jgi:hypothetical protein
MPTPTQSEIFASLETNTWVTMKTETLMPNKIMIGQSLQVQGDSEFVISNYGDAHNDNKPFFADSYT